MTITTYSLCDIGNGLQARDNLDRHALEAALDDLATSNIAVSGVVQVSVGELWSRRNVGGVDLASEDVVVEQGLDSGAVVGAARQKPSGVEGTESIIVGREDGHIGGVGKARGNVWVG